MSIKQRHAKMKANLHVFLAQRLRDVWRAVVLVALQIAQTLVLVEPLRATKSKNINRDEGRTTTVNGASPAGRPRAE
jgi:hypothetical protein